MIDLINQLIQSKIIKLSENYLELDIFTINLCIVKKIIN